eukprot:maker-scaffold373_size192110-snap-gene-0.43 protein:Tk03512 transcript:maker-scaffold373_size192110-snap-gene-0.43-mRNA-1 annotation:"alpha- -n-acetylglucosaminyltransferase-like"
MLSTALGLPPSSILSIALYSKAKGNNLALRSFFMPAEVKDAHGMQGKMPSTCGTLLSWPQRRKASRTGIEAGTNIRTSVNSANPNLGMSGAVKAKIDTNPRNNVRKIARELNVDKNAVSRIMKNDLGMSSWACTKAKCDRMFTGDSWLSMAEFVHVPRCWRKWKYVIMLTVLAIYAISYFKILLSVWSHWEPKPHHGFGSDAEVVPKKKYEEEMSSLVWPDELLDNGNIPQRHIQPKMTKRDHRLSDDYGDLETIFKGDVVQTDNDVLTELAASIRSESIFFVEYNSKKSEFHCLETCAFETASRLNPNVDVYLIIHHLNSHLIGVPAPLENRKNIHTLKVNIERVIAHELATNYDVQIPTNKSIQSTLVRQLFKIILLHRIGGVALESDLVSIRPISFEIANFLSMAVKSMWESLLKFQPGNIFLQKAISRVSELVKSENKNRGRIRLVLQDIVTQLCPLDGDGKIYHCPEAWNLTVNSALDPVAIESWSWAKNHFLWRPNYLDKFPSLLALHFSDLPKDVCDSPEEGTLPRGFLNTLRRLCPSTFQLVRSNIGDIAGEEDYEDYTEEAVN